MYDVLSLAANCTETGGVQVAFVYQLETFPE